VTSRPLRSDQPPFVGEIDKKSNSPVGVVSQRLGTKRDGTLAKRALLIKALSNEKIRRIYRKARKWRGRAALWSSAQDDLIASKTHPRSANRD
jgi:hypothetical protein